MKKRAVYFVMIGILLIGNLTPVFAESSTSTGNAIMTTQEAVTTEKAIATEKAITISSEPIKLSLQEATLIMTTKGTRAETADLNRKSDIAVANGYSEKASTIKKTLDGLDQLYQAESLYGDNFTIATGYTSSMVMQLSYEAQVAGATQNNKKILNLRRSFAQENQQNNYQADLNKIQEDTVMMYGNVLLAQDNYKIATDNLIVQQKIMKTINAKKSVGLLSKKDVLQAQTAVMDAEKEVRTSKTKMAYAHMSFNYLLGFGVLQPVTFTDKLAETTTEGIDVELAIESARNNRNEIKGANFAKEIYKILLNDVSAYPKSSSTYLTAQINLLTAEKTAKDAWVQIEIDIRNRAAEVEDKEAALIAAKALQNYAEEGVRLITLTNEEGLSTVDELLNAQVSYYKSKLNVAKAISDYNISLKELKDAQGVGTMRIPL